MRTNSTTLTTRGPSILPKMMALMVAISLPVGCTALPGGVAKLPGQQANTVVSAPKAQTANDAQAASQVQQDMNDLDMLADNESGFATQARPNQASGARAAARIELRAEVRAAIQGLSAERKAKLVKRSAELRQKAAGRLKDTADAFKKGMTREVTDNDLGGKTVTMTFAFTHKNGATRSGSMERVYNADKVLVSAKQTQDWTGPKGNTRHMERTKELQADGSYKISGTASLNVNGKTRTFTWNKTITPDGAVSGTGTLTKFDGSTVTITFGGSEDKETTTATDTTTGTAATVEASADAGADSSATVTDTTSNTATEVTVSTDPATTTDSGTSTSTSTSSDATATPSTSSDTTATASTGA